MKIKTFARNILLGGAISTAFFPLAASADNLLQVYELARQNDTQYRAAIAAYEAARESSSQAWAPMLPQITATGYKTDTTTDTKSVGSGSIYSVGETETETTGYSINLTQAIYRHQNFVGIRQADAQVAQAEANYRNAEQALILRVAESYFNVLSANDNLIFALSEKKSIGEQLNQTRQRFNVGLTAITDVHEAKARYDQAVAQSIAAENQLDVSKELLRVVTGQLPAALAPLSKDNPLLRPTPDNINQWVQTAQDNSLDLLAAEKAREIAQAEVDKQRAGHYPTLDLVASKSSNDTTSGTSALQRETEDTSVSLQLTVPLYSGGRTSSATRAAAANYMQAKEQYELQRRSTEQQTRSAYLSVIANISQVEAFKQALASTKTALAATQAGFEVGTRTAVDVLNSQRELYRAQRDYAGSRYNYILETLRLKQAAGILNAEDIAQINQWLN